VQPSGTNVLLRVIYAYGVFSVKEERWPSNERLTVFKLCVYGWGMEWMRMIDKSEERLTHKPNEPRELERPL
jgi:hypothetical protein